jgi:hypothetical protein
MTKIGGLILGFGYKGPKVASIYAAFWPDIRSHKRPKLPCTTYF